MHPEPPSDLCHRVVQHLKSKQTNRTTPAQYSSVCEGIQRDLWIDYLADSGDSTICSSVVASMVFDEYDLPSASPRRLLVLI
jgi:hypothetical protein